MPHRLRLSAAKSRAGHAETAAGAIGIGAALLSIEAQPQPPIAHLRHFNPYVLSILETAAKGPGVLPCIPRQVMHRQQNISL